MVGSVANFKAAKDHATLLRAAVQVREAIPSVRFVLVGQGPLEAETRRLAGELGLDATVVFAGFRTDATRLMAAFDAFALSSTYEGLPIALIEAMATGCPAVVTRVGGTPEVVADGVQGFLVPPRDPAALAAGLTGCSATRTLRAGMGGGRGRPRPGLRHPQGGAAHGAGLRPPPGLTMAARGRPRSSSSPPACSVGLAAALACLWLWWRRPERPPAVAGLALAAAAAAGYAVAAPPPPRRAGGRRWPWRPPPWPPPWPPSTAAGGAPAGAGLLAVTAAGIWATVPDVEAALVLLGRALAMALLGWPCPWPAGPAGRRRPSGWPGRWPWRGARLGGRQRRNRPPRSVVGGLACLGLLAVEPVARGLDPRRRSPLDRVERRPGLAWAALAAQLALVAVGQPGWSAGSRAATALAPGRDRAGAGRGRGRRRGQAAVASRRTAP